MRTRPRNLPQRSLRRLAAQPPCAPRGLRIGAVDDPLEREADAVADRVMRVPDPGIGTAHAPPQVRHKCAACEGEQSKMLRSKPAGLMAATSHEAPPIVHEALRRPGQPLDAVSRAFFEPRFGVDLGVVRLDTVDFCPGGLGTGLATIFTVPVSVLEATEAMFGPVFAADVPFDVIYPGPGTASSTVPVVPSPFPPPPSPTPAPHAEHVHGG